MQYRDLLYRQTSQTVSYAHTRRSISLHPSQCIKLIYLSRIMLTTDSVRIKPGHQRRPDHRSKYHRLWIGRTPYRAVIESARLSAVSHHKNDGEAEWFNPHFHSYLRQQETLGGCIKLLFSEVSSFYTKNKDYPDFAPIYKRLQVDNLLCSRYDNTMCALYYLSCFRHEIRSAYSPKRRLGNKKNYSDHLGYICFKHTESDKTLTFYISTHERVCNEDENLGHFMHEILRALDLNMFDSASIPILFNQIQDISEIS